MIQEDNYFLVEFASVIINRRRQCETQVKCQDLHGALLASTSHDERNHESSLTLEESVNRMSIQLMLYRNGLRAEFVVLVKSSIYISTKNII